jgi:O-antigen/teichoic acid export membrane protein
VLVKLLIGLWLASLGAGAAGVMAGFAAGAGLSLLHSLWVVRRARLFQNSAKLLEWRDSNVAADTLPLFAGMLGVALMLNLDVLGLKLFSPGGSGDELAGFYQAAVILARTPVFLAQALTLVLFSYVAASERAGETAGSPVGEPGDPAPETTTRRYLRLAFKSWGRLLLPGGLALALAPQAALRLFFPARYQQGELVLQVAALGGVLLALVTLLSGVLQAAGKRRAAAVSSGLAVSAQLLVLAWMVPGWGSLAAALSLLAAGLVALATLLPSVLAFSPASRALLLFRFDQAEPLVRRLLGQAAALAVLRSCSVPITPACWLCCNSSYPGQAIWQW